MAGRPKKTGTIKDEILKQEEAVAKSKASTVLYFWKRLLR